MWGDRYSTELYINSYVNFVLIAEKQVFSHRRWHKNPQHELGRSKFDVINLPESAQTNYRRQLDTMSDNTLASTPSWQPLLMEKKIRVPMLNSARKAEFS